MAKIVPLILVMINYCIVTKLFSVLTVTACWDKYLSCIRCALLQHHTISYNFIKICVSNLFFRTECTLELIFGSLSEYTLFLCKVTK